MVRFVMLLFVAMSVGSLVAGTITSYNLGGNTYWNGTDASGKPVSGSSYNLGGNTYYDFGNGNTASSYQLGGKHILQFQ